MAVYRFKVCMEDNEDIARDIDINAAQTFLQFHTIIQEAFKFDAKHAASFFVSDDYWRKGQEITLNKEDLPLEEEEIRKGVDPKKLMADTKIARYIDQPHQRFVYVFDPNAQWSFLIEMVKIAEENKRLVYPSIIRSYGNPPKQYKQILPPKAELNPDNPLAALLAEPEADDEEIFKAIETGEEGIEEDDIDSLEGEEGEEEEQSEEGEDESGDFGFEHGEEEEH
ncbi:MAG: hypothetical protein IT236_07090 [Bacteroidia bacterium]|nr:hypothetical protein [Bacteroidia bacterium]